MKQALIVAAVIMGIVLTVVFVASSYWQPQDAWVSRDGLTYAASAPDLKTWWPVAPEMIPEASERLGNAQLTAIDSSDGKKLTKRAVLDSNASLFLVRGLELSKLQEREGLSVRWDEREGHDELAVFYPTESCFLPPILRRAPLVVAIPRRPKIFTIAEMPNCP